MYNLLLKLMLAVTLLQLGFVVTDFKDCGGRMCTQKLEEAKRFQ